MHETRSAYARAVNQLFDVDAGAVDAGAGEAAGAELEEDEEPLEPEDDVLFSAGFVLAESEGFESPPVEAAGFAEE